MVNETKGGYSVAFELDQSKIEGLRFEGQALGAVAKLGVNDAKFFMFCSAFNSISGALKLKPVPGYKIELGSGAVYTKAVFVQGTNFKDLSKLDTEVYTKAHPDAPYLINYTDMCGKESMRVEIPFKPKQTLLDAVKWLIVLLGKDLPKTA